MQLFQRTILILLEPLKMALNAKSPITTIVIEMDAHEF